MITTTLQCRVVDDDPVALGVLGDTLAAVAHKIIQTNSGAEALALIDGANPESLPDMAFHDIGMWDGMNGFEVCCRLKAIRRQTAGGIRPAEEWAKENV